MSRVVYKYVLQPGIVARIPPGKVVAVDFQHGQPTAWVEHQQMGLDGFTHLEIVPTGARFDRGIHVGSAISDDLVWHVYAS